MFIRDIFDRFGSNFFVAAFVPSFAFVIITRYILALSIRSIENLSQSSYATLSEGVLFTLSLATVIGFILSNLSNYVIKLYEGDFLLERFSLLKKNKEKARVRLERKIEKLETDYKNAVKEMNEKLKSKKGENARECTDKEIENTTGNLSKLKDDLYETVRIYNIFYCPAIIKPTRFGNIMRATDYYTLSHYGFSGEKFWPNLLNIIPRKLNDQIELYFNGLAFILNCSVLSLILSVLCLVVSLFQTIYSNFEISKFIELFADVATILPKDQISLERISLFLIVSSVFAILFYVFYLVAVQVALQYGQIFRSTYDLYHSDLLKHILKQAKEKLPKTTDEEYMKWKEINNFSHLSRYYYVFEDLPEPEFSDE